MSQPELEPQPVKYNVIIDDASDLPILHVNALNLRISLDEFYFTLGIIQPPDQAELPKVAEAGHAVAQPVFRFAVSRYTMEQFLSVMAGLYDQQTTMLQRMNHSSGESIKEE
ncbi:MAG: hypothetical protein ACR2H5_26660 [Ktedonobacteraceae bacterium]